MMRLVLLAAAARFFASTTAIAHRIAVPSAAATVQLSTLDGTLEIRGRDGQVLRGQTSGFSTTPCRAVTEGELRLRCSSGRLDAALEHVGDRAYLDLRELRGLPAGSGDEALPRFVYAPDRLGLGAACPGSNPPSRGECLMQAGQTELAKQELERAAQSEFTRPFAMVRLGDLALAESGPDAAVSPWASAAGPTPFGRVAAARLCEATGDCLLDPDLREFDSTDLAEPLRTEMDLRGMRALALTGRWPETLDRLRALFADGDSCGGRRERFCRRVAVAAIGAPGRPAESALNTYLAIPSALEGPYAAALARVAAAASDEVGAPSYGAAILSATVHLADASDLSAHLRQAQSLYLRANDPVRAQVVADYARMHLPDREVREWPASPPPPPQGVDIEPAERLATLEQERARAVLAIAASATVRARRLAGVTR